MEYKRIDLDDGKYTVIYDNGKIEVLRHGGRWKNLTGCGLTLACISKIDELERELKKSMQSSDHITEADHLAILRDQFAMAALQGIMANPSGPIQANGMSGWGWCNCSSSDVTNLVYSVADEMLKERKK